MAGQDPYLEECLTLFRAKTGLVFENADDVAAAIRGRAQALGLSGLDAYRELLADERRGLPELGALAQRLTNNETYFFRDQAQLQAAAGWGRALLLERGRKPLRCWSAGCSSGEEPYSLAILLRESLPREEEASFSVLATDIDDGALARAGEGRYGARSVRNVPGPLAERYLPRRDDCWEVSADLRARVRFAHHSLLSGQPEPGEAGFDLLLCRNVLIYFDRPSLELAIARFATLLRPGGALFLGPSESLQFHDTPFRAVKLEGAFAYVLEPSERRPSEPRAQPRTERKEKRLRESVSPPPPPRASPATPTVPPLEAAREAHRAGRHVAAAGICLQVLESNPLEAGALRILYQAQHELGDSAACEATIRRLLYLEPKDVASRYLLGRMRLRAGDAAAGRRELASVLDVCRAARPGDVVPDTDGLTFDMMIELCRSALGEPSSRRTR